MKISKQIPRFLGAAFLVVIVTSLVGNVLFDSAAGTGSISDILVNISNQTTTIHFSILAQMITGSLIIALAVLLYTVFQTQNRLLARIALGAWIVEVVFLAVSQLGSLALISLSTDFVAAGAPASSYFQTMGQFLYEGVQEYGMTMHMWFYCVGGLLWYFLMDQSRYIPRVISLLGVVVAAVGTVGVGLEFLGYTIPIFVYLPIGVFELAVGLWLVIRGIKFGDSSMLVQQTELGALPQ